MSLPCVIAVILNTNHREDTLECLTSLEQNHYEQKKAILLDNSSIDGSVEAVAASFPDVLIIRLSANLGYAGNNNVGIDAAMKQGADWVLVLNEDTVLDPDCIQEMVSAGEADPKIGIVGPLVYHRSEPQVIQTAGGRMDRFLRGWHLAQDEPDRGEYREPIPVEWISGCAIMVRRAVIEQVGGIDARFFYYYEEFEWCLRSREAGWRIVCSPKAKMWHKGVQRNHQPKPSVTYYATRNHFLVLSKHNASWMAWIVNWCDTLRTLGSWTIKPKWRSKREHRDAMLRGIRDFLWHRWGMMRQ